MPTLTQDSVRVLPMSSRTAMTLEEIRQAMIMAPPILSEFTGGWASISDEGSNLRGVGVAPAPSEPVLTEKTPSLPSMLQARFYFWDVAQTHLRGQDPLQTRKLNAVDVIITMVSDSRIGILVSSRTNAVLGGKGKVLDSLNQILQKKDETIKIERGQSHLRLLDEEIFLWLAVQQRDKPQLSPSLSLDAISGINSQDESRRTAELKLGVDFERPNFLTSVAESDTLGPIDVCFTKIEANLNYMYDIRIHIDGGFEFRKSGLHFPDPNIDDEIFLSTSIYLAYSLIPSVNRLYIDNLDTWSTQRTNEIKKAITALNTRYEKLLELLEDRLVGEKALEPDPT